MIYQKSDIPRHVAVLAPMSHVAPIEDVDERVAVLAMEAEAWFACAAELGGTTYDDPRRYEDGPGDYASQAGWSARNTAKRLRWYSALRYETVKEIIRGWHLREEGDEAGAAESDANAKVLAAREREGYIDCERYRAHYNFMAMRAVRCLYRPEVVELVPSGEWAREREQEQSETLPVS